MSSPTTSEIHKAFPNLDPDQVKELVAALAAPDAVSDNDDRFVQAVDVAMEKANEILGGHGVEAASGEGSDLGKYWRDTILVYVNLGDPYDTTILFDPDEEEFSVGGWGDFIEEWEQEDDEEESEEEGEEEEEDEDDEDDGDGEEAEEEDAETEEAE